MANNVSEEEAEDASGDEDHELGCALYVPSELSYIPEENQELLRAFAHDVVDAVICKLLEKGRKVRQGRQLLLKLCWKSVCGQLIQNKDIGSKIERSWEIAKSVFTEMLLDIVLSDQEAARLVCG